VLLRDKQSEKDEARLLAGGRCATAPISARLSAASRTAQLRAAEAFQLNYKVSLLLLYMLHNRREVLGLAEEDVARATLALDPPTLPRPPKVPRRCRGATCRSACGPIGVRPSARAAVAGKKRRQKARPRREASKIAKQAAEQLREKKKALSRKWGKLARSFSANLGAKERSSGGEEDGGGGGGDRAGAVPAVPREEDRGARAVCQRRPTRRRAMTAEQRTLMLCRECVMCAHCGTEAHRGAAHGRRVGQGRSRRRPVESRSRRAQDGLGLRLQRVLRSVRVGQGQDRQASCRS
jgi:hypothetical protein